MTPVPLLLCELKSGVFLSLFRALSSWLLSKKRGMNGPSGERDSSSAALFPSAFWTCLAGLPVGESSSLGGRGGGGGGGGGGEMGDPRSEDREQGEQEESAGLGTGSGGRDVVRAVTGWVVSVELGSVCTLVLRHSGWFCIWTPTESTASSPSLTPASMIRPRSLLLVWDTRSRVDFRIT